MMNEFDESDMSDYEYEEAEDPCSESDFEKDDEHQINKDCIAACSEESYNGFWRQVGQHRGSSTVTRVAVIQKVHSGGASPIDSCSPQCSARPIVVQGYAHKSSNQKGLSFIQIARSLGQLVGIGSFPSSTPSSSSTPEPDHENSVESLAEKLNHLFNKRPTRMSDMLRIIAIFGDATPDEKLQLVKAGVMKRLCLLIEDSCNLELTNKRQGSSFSSSCCSNSTLDGSGYNKRGRSANLASAASTLRLNSADSTRGIGYGRGSTKSRWDIERAVEEKVAQEETLMWLLCALTTFLWGESVKMSEIDVETMRTDKIKAMAEQSHLCKELVEQIANDSPIIALLEYHLNNDSVFDISCHIDFYQALLELATGLSFIPAFLPYLVLPKNDGSKTISTELIPRFREILNTYPLTIRGHASPDLNLMDFIRKTNDLSDIIVKMARQFEESSPKRRVVVPEVVEESRKSRLVSAKSGQVMTQNLPKSLDTQYSDLLRPFQINTYKILNDASKPIFGFTFKKELRNVNPVSSSHKDRIKRIAKELVSMHSSLPLNASNSIFVCMDETRCDMLKVLISGPDGTPYQNGLFEFDVFFPTNYPHQPPKCSFLTTGAGTVRFNPNLYNDGKICISILGTWDGRPEEKWNSFCSLLQVLVSIQGLIFSSQPYFNEPGFEKFQGTLKGDEFSRKYNLHIENATLIYAIMEQYENAPPYFMEVIKRHFWLKRQAVINQAEKWLQEVARQIQNNANDASDQDNSVMEGMFVSPMVQRQKVRNLIEKFRDMKNPMEE